MEGFTKSRVGLSLLLLSMCGFAVAQDGPGNPKWNVNIVGPTPDPADVRDMGLRQQNEPACAIRPGDSSCIICAYNDYRTLDIPAVQDAWQGVSMSCDGGTRWFSRIAPGHGADLIAPIDAQFAADPRLSAIPGMAILNFIGGVRGEDRGVLAIQHWLESNQEDGNFYEPGAHTIIAETGTDGRFIDKPELLAVIDEGGQADPVRLSTLMENPDLGTIDRLYPPGTLYLAYAVFTGSQSVKLMVKTSKDWGQTWSNKSVKLSESQNLVSGITMTEMGGKVLAVWRQAGDVNDSDAMYYSLTTNGKVWSKPAVLTNVCQFDQVSSTTAVADSSPKTGERVTFRTNDFPWVANDGQYFYAFYSDRKTDSNQFCDGRGVAKLYMRYSADGTNWSTTPIAIDNSVESAPGYQFMPAAFGANGKVQVAWYDTRRENIVDATLNTIADYSPDGFSIVNRKIDVYTAKVGVVDGSVTVSPSTRVSQYRSLFYPTVDFGEGEPTLYEAEASFGNAMLYGSGFLAFIGDYIAVAGQQFRPDGNDGWTSNSPAENLENPALNKADFYVAWADHRDLRGDFLYGSPGSPPTEYTPPDNLPPPSAVDATSIGTDTPVPEKEVLLATSGEPATPVRETGPQRRLSSEGVEDTPVDPSLECVMDLDRTRDANIYGALVRDEKLRMSAPTPSKPLNAIQRAYPVALTNVNPEPLTYRLFISDQPDGGGGATFNRASFRQQPAIPPFPGSPPFDERVEELEIPANSTFARTVFVNSTNPAASVTINAYDTSCSATSEVEFEDCDILATIRLGGTAQAGTLLQPDYESGVCDDAPSGSTCYEDVLLAELHNPRLENPELENPRLENPELENLVLLNPRLENPELENPLLEAPRLENPELENYGFENPELENPELENPRLENPRLENPELENPRLENAALDDGAIYYADITAAITNDGNVTTAYSADLTITSSLAEPGVDSQLIAWTQYVTPTSRDCLVLPEVTNQVLSVVQNPDAVLSVANIGSPFIGELSFIAVPGQTVFVTHRIFGTVAELEAIAVAGFTASSQASNCIDNDGNVGDDYFCETSLRAGNEQIILDTTGPEFIGLANGDVIPAPPVSADVPGDPLTGSVGGACVDLVGTGLVSATDESDVTIECTLVDAPSTALCTDSDPDAGLTIQAATLLSPGPTLVNCTATDEAGNSTSIQIGVAVEDGDAPSFTIYPMLPVQIDADDTGTATLDFESLVVAVDAGFIDPNPVVSCLTSPGGQVSNDPLNIGLHNVICTAEDASGNLSNPPAEFDVVVNDVSAPTFDAYTPPSDTLEATSSAGAELLYTMPTASDNSGSADVSCTPVSGTIIPISSIPTTVTCTATDNATPTENTATLTFDVTVVDTTAPTFDPYTPPGPTLQATSSAGAALIYATPTASDISGNASVSCTPVSGTIIPISLVPTTVICTATDNAAPTANTATLTFDVTVVDTTAPTFDPYTPPNSTLEATSSAGAELVYTTPTAIDAAGSADVSCAPTSGSIIPISSVPTTVTCTATDNATPTANTATLTFDVTVVDTTAPTVSASDVFVELIDAIVDIDIDYITGEVTDLLPDPDVVLVPASGNVVVADVVDPSPALSCYVVNPGDPADMTNTANPQNFSGYGTSTVSCTAMDSSGNTSSAATFDIGVSFPYEIELILPKGQARAGSTIPIDFRYYLGNTLIDSSSLSPLIQWIGPYGSNDSSCSNGTSGTGNGQDSGSSSLRYSASTDTYQFSWQTPDISESAFFLLIVSPPGVGFDSATECVRLR
jgi:hypothetical protein